MEAADGPGRNFEHVNYLWDETYAAGLDPVERLVYRSNLLGADRRITNAGGGNTSSKIAVEDPLSGERVDVLWVKGSGSDLRTAGRDDFASFYLEKLLALEPVYASAVAEGAKRGIGDRMAALFPRCTFDRNPRAGSIDTPLHAFLPARTITHVHPNAVIAIATARRSCELTEEVFGEEVAWVPWQRPGFALGLALRDLTGGKPGLGGVVLGHHGLVCWADDDRACYETTLRLIEKAARFIAEHDRGEATFGGERYPPLAAGEREALQCELLPWLRGRLSQNERFIATVQDDAGMLRFVNSADAPRLAELGTACPDHFLRTKLKPLFAEWDPRTRDLDVLKQALSGGLERYRRDYTAYYERCAHDDSPPMRDLNPTVILIPGVGMIAWGRNKSESRVTAEYYSSAVEVMRGAEAIDEYVALPEQEAFDMEYWALEEAKLRRMPPEGEFARRIVVVVGAGSGIGRASAQRLAREGAHVVCADLSEEAARETAAELTETAGEGIGVAGTGISGCGPAIGIGVDITDRASVRDLFARTILAYGGVDHIVVTAGVHVPPDQEGGIEGAPWRRAFDVNGMEGDIVCDEARRIWEAQGLRDSAVLTTGQILTADGGLRTSRDNSP